MQVPTPARGLRTKASAAASQLEYVGRRVLLFVTSRKATVARAVAENPLTCRATLSTRFCKNIFLER